MPNDFDKYVAYRLSTGARSERAQAGCAPMVLVVVLAVLVVIGLAIFH